MSRDLPRLFYLGKLNQSPDLRWLRVAESVISTVSRTTAGVHMALAAVLCLAYARADALPRVLTCSRCHRQQRFESWPRRHRLAKREDALRRDIDNELIETAAGNQIVAL